MTTTKTSYERGYHDGFYDFQRLNECGWNTARACLDREEENYQNNCTRLDKAQNEGRHDSEAYQRQRAYQDGFIARARESLGTLIAQGY